MIKTLKLVTIAVFAICVSCAAFANAGAVSAENGNALSDTKQLYVSNCARCHGADGKGKTSLGMEYDVPDLTGGRFSTAKAKRLITNGDGDMPAFGKKLKPAQITALAAYARSFK